MRKANRIKRARIWVLFSFCVLGLALLIMFNLYRFLAKTDQVSSQVLIVEGWSHEFTLQTAAEELKSKPYKLLITTGGPVLKSGYNLSSNSSLNFNLLTAISPKPDSIGQSTIRVLASGSAVVDGVENKYAHFALSVNDTVVGESYTQRDPKEYSFNVRIGPEAIQRISVAFDNDTFALNNDRNLFIYSVTFNGKIYKPSSPLATLSYRHAGQRIVEPICENLAETSRMAIKKLGVNHIRMVAVPAPYVDIDRTYESAVAVRKWMEVHQPGVHTINVLTEGMHARRSWMMYKKAFGPTYAIGIMAVDDPSFDSDTWWQSWKGTKLVMIQLGKYLYAQFYFSPFA